MTDSDIDKLAERILEKRGGFYVEPEEHYQQHERLEKILEMYDTAGNIFIKALISAVFIGIFALAAMGLGWHK